MQRIYRVTGTDRHGDRVTVAKFSEDDARRSAERANRNAAKRGAPQDWQAAYAEVEWRHIDAQLMDFEQ